MPRKAFIADLQETAEILDIDHLSSLRAGDEDGIITFKFHSLTRPTELAPGVKISAIVPGTSYFHNRTSTLGIFADHQYRCL